MIAICGAFLVTSSIQGNCSRLIAFSWRRNAASVGNARLLFTFHAWYCRSHSASPQLNAKRAVPAARAR